MKSAVRRHCRLASKVIASGSADRTVRRFDCSVLCCVPRNHPSAASIQHREYEV